MLEDKGIYAPTEVVMKDMRDETRTIVAVEDLEVDSDLDERSFQVERARQALPLVSRARTISMRVRA